MFKKKVWMSVLLVLTLAVLSFAGCSGQQTDNRTGEGNPQQSLMVYSGAGLRKPMDEIGQVFEEKYGVRIEYSYAGSAQNLSQIEMVKEGDLYIPGALYYIECAQEKGFVSGTQNVVYHIPVIGVPKGNPANITCLDDLAKPGIKVVLGDERSAAIGKTAQKILKDKGILEQVEMNVVSKDATVNEVMVHIAMKQADACIIWEDNVKGVEEVEVVRIADEENDVKTIPIGVLTFSEQPELAQQFADFVVSVEGKQIFQKHGFKPVE